MKNRQVLDDSIDPEEETLDKDNPAVAEDGTAFCINKTNKKAKSVKLFLNEDHVVRKI